MTKFDAWFGEFALLSTISSLTGAINLLFEIVNGEHSCFFDDISWDTSIIVVILFKKLDMTRRIALICSRDHQLQRIRTRFLFNYHNICIEQICIYKRY